MKRAALFVLAQLAACSHPRTPVVAKAHVAKLEGALSAGVARVDITTPPGPSTFGHGPDAHVTYGYWSRIECRVFLFQTSDDDRVALVPCDLPAVSLLLHRAVAARIAHVVPTQRLFISATHTHAGPAHYFESEAYAGPLSTHLPGFDPEMVKFLADKIAGGIARAKDAMRPAAIRWTHGTKWGLTRNRSLRAFAENEGAWPYQPEPDPGPTPTKPPADEVAIDPGLDVLEVEELDAARTKQLGPRGWLAFFAMHPTVITARNRYLGADIHGVASRAIESELRRRNGAEPDPLAGIFNTNEGDMSPIWSRGDIDEAIDVGRRFANAILTLPKTGTFSATTVLDTRYIEAHLPDAKLSNGDQLCSCGELGAGSGHGGSDHPTSLDALFPPMKELDPKRHDDCQLPKATLLGGIQGFLLGRSPNRFPSHVSFGLVRLGDSWISFVPAEMTVHAGDEVKRAVLRHAPPGTHALIGGLSNAYIQYVATAKEYGLQLYEGASTLYGPKSSAFFADRLELGSVDEWRRPGDPGRELRHRYSRRTAADVRERPRATADLRSSLREPEARADRIVSRTVASA